jgi:hypothetical protein
MKDKRQTAGKPAGSFNLQLRSHGIRNGSINTENSHPPFSNTSPFSITLVFRAFFERSQRSSTNFDFPSLLQAVTNGILQGMDKWSSFRGTIQEQEYLKSFHAWLRDEHLFPRFLQT